VTFLQAKIRGLKRAPVIASTCWREKTKTIT